MENKLLTYILQMQKQSSTQSVPRLAKAQTGISMNVESGTYKPTAKVVTQADIKRQQEEVRRQEEQARKDKLNAAVKRQRENQSYISQDNRTAGERENDRIKGMNAQMQEIQRNSPLAQTFGSFTPSGYNPGAGSVAANQFVRTVPLIVAGAAGARALPSIMAGLNAPMAGVAGLTGNNIMNAGFAYEAAKNLPNVGRSIKTAYQNPTLSNIGDATAETALTALNALPFAAEASRGVAPLANEIKSAFTLTGPQRNLKDLNYAKKVYGPLGYQIPENLERIAKSDVLTDRTVRGLVNRDNSVYRGVNVDLEALKERLVRSNKLFSKFSGKPPQEAIDQYDVLIGNLKKANVDVNNPEEIAKYMATHIPAETGAGRAYLDPDVMKKKGISGLYTSNSKGTAEGYTYGEGYVVKAKKPTDFSSSSRKAWIDNNIPDIQTGKDYKYSRFFPKPITWKTDYQINDSRSLANYREKLGRQKLEADYPSTPTEYNGETWDAIHPEVRKFNDRRDQLRNIAEEEYNLAADPYKDKLFTVEDRLKRRSENYKLNNTSTFKKVLNVPAIMRDLMMEGYYGGKVSRLNQKNADAWNDATLATYLEKYPELANAYPEVNPYAHYINIGKPGEKVLEAMSTRKITPETWKNKSRGHQGEYFRQATRREFGGMYGSGGPIVDPMGQWAHPGKITRIPSSNITMQGVPYPVLGVASSGQQVMMQPGQDYNFGDAEYVDEYPMMANGGYTVTRSNDRKGKTHKVTGPGGVVKYFGDSKLGQHPKDPERKAAFYARHKKNLDGNPFFRAFARKTWEDGGTIPQYQFAGPVSKTDSVRHQANKILQYEQLRGGPGGAPLPQYSNPKYMDMLMGNVYPEVKKIMPNASAMEAGEAMDFIFNAGWDKANNKITKDPRAFALQEYYRENDRSKLDVDGKWAGRKNAAYSFDQEYDGTIGKLPENQRRVLMNKGRDWFYQNTAPKGSTWDLKTQGPHPDYKDTWYGRIWNTNDYQPFDAKNPNFVPKKQMGGQTDDDREMLSGVADMLRRVNDVNNRKQIANYMMNNFREEDVSFEPNKFLKSANAFKEGGEMIRRADGSYSPRGLWDNIRDNAGSGKKPTKQMLEQERKINSMQFGGLIKAQTGKQVKSKPLFSQSQIDLYNRLVAEKEAAEKEAAAKKLAAMREYYENRPHFSQNNSPREEPTPWVDPVLGRIDRENNQKYADSDGGFENFAEFLDPTGISSWDDVGRTFRNPSASNMERGFALFSALPIVGKLGKLAKGAKAVNTAVKGNALQKIGRGALKGAAKTVDIVTGGPAMRYFDQTINPLSRGFGTLTEKAVGQIPYSGVRKVFEIGSDFNQMRRFQDGVLIPGFNQLDNYMTQPANSQKPWWQK